jgi:hypothetical protein
MDTEFGQAPIYHMLFDLGNIVGHVVYCMEIKVLDFASQYFLKAATSQVGHALPVCPSIVGRPSHGPEVALTLGRIEGGADQLAVR